MLNDLRSFLNLLEEKKDLVHISRPTSTTFEIAAGIRKTSEIEGPGVAFRQCNGSFNAARWWFVRGTEACGMGAETTPEQIHGKIMEGLKNDI